jgi:RimJ/RimL family protein N-acetyltransferase
MEDLDELFDMYAEPQMTDFVEPLYPYEEEREYQQAYIAHMYPFYGYGMWNVREKATGRLIGRVGIEHREELLGEPELGYVIRTSARRQGYAEEVCRAVLSYAKEQLGFSELCCLIEPDNEISIRFAKKLSFSYAQTMTIGGKMLEKYVVRLTE